MFWCFLADSAMIGATPSRFDGRSRPVLSALSGDSVRTYLNCFRSIVAIGLLALATPASAQNTLTVSPNPLTYTFQVGTSPPNPAPLIIFSTAGTANYSLTWAVDEGTWLTVAPTSGTTPSNSSLVFINPAGLAPKTYTGRT
jgi:hypothetical protein